MCSLITALIPAWAFAQLAEPSLAESSSAQPPSAEPAPATPAQPAAATQPAEPASPAEPAKPVITIGGYIEEYYQLQLQDPSNRITNLRGYDNRSRTFTLSNVASLRLEYRHDQATDNAFLGGDVTTDPMTQSFVPNRKSQDTVTLGVTAWF